MHPDLYYLERYRNLGTRDYSPHADYTEARKDFRPDAPSEGFLLPRYALPRDSVRVVQSGPSPGLVQRYLDPEEARICVHPQLLEPPLDDPYLNRIRWAGRPLSPLRVSPSASTRTLYVLDDDIPHALKVHFPFRVSRYSRKLREEVLEQAVAVSGEMEEWLEARPGDFAFMREVLGMALRPIEPETERGENWGFLVRETTPFPPAGEARSLVPGFALYGRDLHDPAREILLWELAGDSNPVAFVLESVLLPIIRHWVSCFLATGFILEPHGQNVLLEVDGRGRVKRIVHRDLNVGIDMRRRRELGRSEEALGPYNRMDTGEFASIAFDRFMGGHFFHRLFRALRTRFPELKESHLQGPCREEFACIFPDHEAYLPRTVHYFSEERDPFGKPLYLDTGETPDWRP